MSDRTCTMCRLALTSKGPVWGTGNPSSRLWWIGEAPGQEEDKQGVPFVGKAGQERIKYAARHGIREPEYITNLVKCRPPQNRDPRQDEIDTCISYLWMEMLSLPKEAVIVTLGRFSTAAMLGEADMEMMNGIPHFHPQNPDWIVVPVYHPALGLYDGRWMTHIDRGFKAVADVLAERIGPWDWVDPIKPDYREVFHPDEIEGWDTGYWGVDTETVGGRIWSVQISTSLGKAYFLNASNEYLMDWVREIAESGKVLFVLHNALFDLPVLAQAGIYPMRWTDTMIMAHLLDEPKGLKVLGFRLAKMKLPTYESLVGPYNDHLIIPYLREVASREWPLPPAEETIVKGKIKLHQPQPLHKVAERILKKSLTPYADWMRQEHRRIVEEVLGPPPEASLADIPREQAIEYACRDADATRRIYPVLHGRVNMENLNDALYLDLEVLPMVARFREVGVQLDDNYLRQLLAEYEQERRAILEKIREQVGYYLNPASPLQVAELLKRMRVKLPKTKNGGDSTSQDFLERVQDKHPVIPDILRYREVTKLEGSFVERLLEMQDPDGRVRDDISLTRTASGRLASSILLLIPTRSEDGRRLRKALVAKPGCVILAADYSQIELRVLAHMSQDKLMIDCFTKDIDLHSFTASRLFGLPMEQVDKWEHRYPAKTINFGIAYGMDGRTLFREMGKRGWTLEQCEEFVEEWKRLFKGVADYMKTVHLQAKRFGYVVSLFGRKRLIPEVRSAHSWVREKGLRNAGNHPIQCSAQEIMKVAMSQLWKRWQEWRKQGCIEPIIQIHDDLKWEMEEGMVPKVAPVIKNIMESAVKLRVPLVVDMEIGKSWGEMEEYHG